MTEDEAPGTVGRRAARSAGPAARLYQALSATDRDVLAWWVLTRIGMVLAASAAPHLFGDGDPPPPLLERWRQWDVWHFERIATHGYFDESWSNPLEAFFPGLPMVLRVGGWFGVPTMVTGLLVSLIAGGVAAVALARLAEREFGVDAARPAALAWMVAPPAVFLAAPYSESLFLALALPAWLAARSGRWPVAAGLAAGACTVRVSGLFLAAALAVLFLTSAGRRWKDLPWLAVPVVPVVFYMLYLWANTGSWLQWYEAQAEQWHRGLTSPHLALINTWGAAFGGEQEPGFTWMFRAELVAMLVGVALTVALLWYRRWGEATWVGVQVAAFATSAWFFSVPRATLLWFPLWMLLGAVGAARGGRVWWWRGYLAIAVPLCGVWAVAFLTGRWAG